MTWALGHLLELAEPEAYDSKLALLVDQELLPIVPETRSRSRPKDGQKKRLDARSSGWASARTIDGPHQRLRCRP